MLDINVQRFILIYMDSVKQRGKNKEGNMILETSDGEFRLALSEAVKVELVFPNDGPCHYSRKGMCEWERSWKSNCRGKVIDSDKLIKNVREWLLNWPDLKVIIHTWKNTNYQL